MMSFHRTLSLVVGCAVAVAAGSSSRAGDWPSFRGAGGTGVAEESKVPSEWSGEKNIAWKAKLPGRGLSSPIVWKDRIYLTSASSEMDGRPGQKGGGGGFPKGGPGGPGGGGGYGGAKPPDVPFKFEVHCLKLSTGEPVWKQLALEAKPKIATHGSNTYATETPVIDDGRLYAYFGMHGLFCYDLDGKLLWKKDLGSYPMTAGWGTASSPIAEGGKVFLQIDNEEKSFFVALDGKTGEQVWRVERAEKTTWGSPIVWKNKVRTELVTLGVQKARSYDPATGKILWELSLGGGRASSTPVSDSECVYFGLDNAGGGRGPGSPGGRPGGSPGGPPKDGMAEGNNILFAVKAGATGDITPKKGETKSEGVVWSRPKAGPQMASPLVYQGHVYVFARNGGTVSCYDAKTGEPAYEKERLPSAKTFWASPWAADGNVYCIDDSGKTFVLKAGSKFELVGTNTLSDTTWSSPAVANGTVLIRGAGTVYAIRN